MYSGDYKYSSITKLFAGMNVADTLDIIAKKGQATFILNAYNYPDGGIAKLFGRTKHNAAAADAAITGLYQLNIESPAFFAISAAKFLRDNGGTFEDKTGAVTITSDPNNLWSFVRFQDKAIAASFQRDQLIEHDGSTGNAAAVSGAPAGKFLGVLANRMFVFNVGSGSEKLGFYCEPDDRTTWPVDNFLNFKDSESDNQEISGCGEHLNNIIVGKESALFRLYHTGTTPPFEYYVVSRNHGIQSHYSVQNIPPVGSFPERMIWVGRDNFYQLIGDDVTSIGDDIKPFFSEGAPFQINLNRLKYCTSGLIKEKNLYWCSFTSGSGSSHDYIFLLDYKNMQWMLCDYQTNCFGSRVVSGREILYSGTNSGFAAKHDTAVYNNLGAAYATQFYFPWIDFGDSQLEKKIKYLIALFDAVGNFDITFEYRTNLETDNFDLEMETGADLLGIDFVLGTSSLGGVEIVERVGEINKRCKRMQLLIIQNTKDEYFRLFSLGVLWKPVRGYRIR